MQQSYDPAKVEWCAQQAATDRCYHGHPEGHPHIAQQTSVWFLGKGAIGEISVSFVHRIRVCKVRKEIKESKMGFPALAPLKPHKWWARWAGAESVRCWRACWCCFWGECRGGRRRCDMQGCVRTALTMLYGSSSMEYGGWTELEPGKCWMVNANWYKNAEQILRLQFHSVPQ